MAEGRYKDAQALGRELKAKAFEPLRIKAAQLRNQLLENLPAQPVNAAVKSILDDSKAYADRDENTVGQYLQSLAAMLPK